MWKPWLGGGETVCVGQDFTILQLLWELRIVYIVIYTGIACKIESPHYENILWS